MPRRFRAGDRLRASDVEFRIMRGDKAKDDLRLDAWLDGRWRPVDMELAFLLVDFFTENEDAIRRSYWRWNGDSYFMKEVLSAWKHGWRVPTEKLQRQQRAQ